jgi:hypothetical protein
MRQVVTESMPLVHLLCLIGRAFSVANFVAVSSTDERLEPWTTFCETQVEEVNAGAKVNNQGKRSAWPR